MNIIKHAVTCPFIVCYIPFG